MEQAEASFFSGSTLISITGLPNDLRQYSLNVLLVLGIAIFYYPNATANAIANPSDAPLAALATSTTVPSDFLV
mgnify:CR=1 FL=1